MEGLPITSLPPREGGIDRLAPTQRPSGRSVMRHRWAHLLFLHWEVSPEALRPLVPPELELDLFDGRAYIGLVPFTMTGIRPTGLPAVRWLSNFHEVNVRTYVHHDGRAPGVWFFSLDAANGIAVRIARRFWHLPYHKARMTLQRQVEPDGREVISYKSERLWPAPLPSSCGMRYEPRGEPGPASPGTLEHFLIERYILYAKRERTALRGPGLPHAVSGPVRADGRAGGKPDLQCGD